MTGSTLLSPPTGSLQDRPRVHGKFLHVGSRRLEVRGFTYGPFAPRSGHQFPAREQVRQDLRDMRAAGANAVRVYTVPPGWLLDEAREQGVLVLVGIPWEQHVAFLDEPGLDDAIERRVRRAVRRCAGHPAVLGYAVGNEIPASVVRWTGRRRVERFIERLWHSVKDEDPEALATYVNYPSTEYLELDFVDFACFNVYLESVDRFASYVKRLHNLAGDRPLVMGELGLDAATHGEIGQARALAAQVRSARRGGCAGSFVFSWTDEWHAGGQDLRDWRFGVTDRGRERKPAFRAVRQAFLAPPETDRGSLPRVSVVICAYNAEDTLADCLDGATTIDYPDYEVLVVDDGSTDRTAAIASRYDVRVISTPNRGLSHARNTGLEAAGGSIVAYVDADARPDRDWLTHLAIAFEETGHAGVGGPNVAPGGDGWIADCVENAPGGPVHVLLSDDEAEHIPGCNMAFRRKALEAIGGFDPRFRVAGDDVDVCWRIQAAGMTLGYSPVALVWHHPRSTIRAYWRQQVGYGRAEALLEEKWPDKYNTAGHVTWGGARLPERDPQPSAAQPDLPRDLGYRALPDRGAGPSGGARGAGIHAGMVPGPRESPVSERPLADVVAARDQPPAVRSRVRSGALEGPRGRGPCPVSHAHERPGAGASAPGGDGPVAPASAGCAAARATPLRAHSVAGEIRATFLLAERPVGLRLVRTLEVPPGVGEGAGHGPPTHEGPRRLRRPLRSLGSDGQVGDARSGPGPHLHRGTRQRASVPPLPVHAARVQTHDGLDRRERRPRGLGTGGRCRLRRLGVHDLGDGASAVGRARMRGRDLGLSSGDGRAGGDRHPDRPSGHGPFSPAGTLRGRGATGSRVRRGSAPDPRRRGLGGRSMKYLIRVLGYVRPFRRLATLSIILTVVVAGLGLLAPWPLKILFDSVLGDHPLPGPLEPLLAPLADDTMLVLLLVVAGGFLITVGENLLSVWNSYAQTRLEQGIILDFRTDLFAHAQRLSMAYHDGRRAGGLIFAINHQADSAAGLLMALQPLVQSGLTIVGMFWITYTIQPQLALLSLVIVPILYTSVAYYMRHIDSRVRDVKNLEGESLSIIHEAVSMLRVIVAFGRERHEQRRFREHGERAVDARVDVTVRQTAFSLAINTTTAAGAALVLGFGVHQILQGRMTSGELLIVIAYVTSIYGPLEAISTTIGSLKERFVSLEIAFNLLDEDPEIVDRPGARAIERAAGDVALERVSFGYAGREETLHHIDFSAPRGSIVGIVGPTGAGKTTLVSLIPRFYDPAEGRVLIDGTDVRDITLVSLRRQVSVVLQEPLLFSGTIRENIRYGRLDATDEEVIDAAKAANAHDFIMSLPRRYSTLLGDRGARLSGGERQRIAIARAFLKDAPILILDEPTSAIDSRTESVILDALDRLMVGRTTFMIAHRLSTIRRPDLILVMDGGRIVEQGTFEELLRSDGLFRELWEIQSRGRPAGGAGRPGRVPVGGGVS